MWTLLLLTSGLLVLGGANRPPYLTANVDIETVRENTPLGQNIFRLTAVDPENSTIHFNVTETRGILRVDPITGWVTVAGVIDRETLDTLEYWIVLEDEPVDGVEKNYVKIPAKLVVLDVNDNPPRFQNVPYDVTVKEDTPVGTMIFTTINVTDSDEIGTELTVYCGDDSQTPETCSRFSLEPLTTSSTKAVYGVILRQPLNFSLRQAHRVLLVANDGAHNVTTTLTVRVGDVQNRPPQFVGSMTGVVSEDDPTGTTIMTVKAVDGDDQDPNPIAYFLMTNPDNSFFLHQDSGKLTLVRRLDREKYLATDGTISAMVKAVEVVNGVPIESSRTTAVATLTVTVKDVNDEPPTFNRDSYSVTMDEGLPDGTPMPDLDMFVSDPDLGTNSVFSLDLQDPTGMFEVDPTVATGSTSVNIRLKSGPLDYENPNHRKFILLVVAKESLTGAHDHASTSTVTITVRDINDNPPEFLQDSYITTVVEDALPETVVTTITATDRDTGKYGTEGLEYALLGNGADKFSVHPKTGMITVGPCERPGSENCLDYETRPVYQLTYQAVDRGGLSSVVPLTIRLRDANDNPPRFLQPKYHAFIDEKSRRFEPPFFIEAVDADETSKVSYAIVSGNSRHLFSIQPDTGELQVTAPDNLDVSQLPSNIILLTVQAADGGAGVDIATVSITVTDINDNTPTFQKQHYTASIPESTPNGTLVEQMVATDSDRDENAQILYRIQKGAFDDFTINATSGSVSVTKSLDFDRRNSYVMEVVAVDGGTPARTGTATLTVHVLNNNDKSPQFSPSTQRTHISEDAAVGTVFYQLAAQDPDVQGPAGLRYGLSGPTTAVDKEGRSLSSAEDFMNYFSVEAATGKVSVARTLERDRAAIVSLTVTAVDTSASPPQTGTGTLVVTIVDVNDFPPAFLPPWTPESPRVSLSVPEEQPTGSAVTTLTATDPDSNIARFEIVPLNPFFEIEPSTGILRTKARLDYEEVKQVKFNVVVYDAGVPQLSAIAMVTVDVLNVNDHSPIFNQTSYKVRLLENSHAGTVVARVFASDQDAGSWGQLGFSLQGERSRDFVIDNQGTIRVAAGANLDRESTPRITVQAVATDQGIDQGQRKSASVPVHVELEDENDNTPEFSKSVYEVSIASSTPARTPIVQLSATDRDLGDIVLFKLLPNDMSGEFELDGKTGVLRMASPPSRLDYELRAEARDADGRGPHLALATVRVSVAGLNRHAPRFVIPALPNATVWIPENQSVPEYLVMTLEATDDDEGDDGKVTFSLKVGDRNVEQTDDFKLNPTTGELWTRGDLDREVRPQYELVLAARDAGSPLPFETLQTLTIKLKDEDDNYPEFSRKQMTNPYKMSVVENTAPGTLVGKVEAVDRDVGDNAHVYYYILDSDGPGLFVIDKLSGEIRTDITLDREQRSKYHLVVKASSNPDYLVFFKSHPLGVTVEERSYKEEDLSLALVEIQISDQNDNVPVFLNTPYLAGVRASAPVGETVLTVTVKDDDSGPNGSVTLRLESVSLLRRGATGPPVQPVPAPFTIEPSGQVVTTQLMAQFDQARFLVSVVAREDAPPHRIVRTTIKLWIYNPSQLVRLILTHPPEEVHSKKKNFTELLSSATSGLAVIDDIRYHVKDKNIVYKKWTDLYIHVVDQNDKLVPIPNVLEAFDSNLLMLQQNKLNIHKVVPAYAELVEDEFDFPLAILILLLVLLFIGLVTMVVCCLCMKNWYAMKIHQKLITAQKKPASDPLSTTENPLWTEQKFKMYEEQELSMTVNPDQQDTSPSIASVAPPSGGGGEVATMNFDTESALYATLGGGYASLGRPASAQKRQRNPESPAYHEVPPQDTNAASMSTFSPPPPPPPQPGTSNLSLNQDGEPMLVTQLL